MVGIDDGLVPRQRGGATDDRLRIAMGEDQARIGKHLKQRGQVEHVLGGLEDPWTDAGDLLRPADQPEKVRHVAIGGRRVLALAPSPVARHMPLRLVFHAPEAGDQQAEFLFGFVGPGGMDRQGARIGEARHLHDAAGEDGAEVLLLARQHLFELRAWDRADRFETAHMRKALVGGEQAVEARGARAHRADDDHRAPQGPGENFGMTREPPLGQQPIAQDVVELLFRRQLARRIEPRFLRDRFEQDLQRPFEPRIAEILEAGRMAGVIEQRGFFEARLVQKAGSVPQLHCDIQPVDKARAARRRGRDRFRCGLQVSPIQSGDGERVAACRIGGSMPGADHRALPAPPSMGLAKPKASGHRRTPCTISPLSVRTPALSTRGWPVAERSRKPTPSSPSTPAAAR